MSNNLFEFIKKIYEEGYLKTNLTTLKYYKFNPVAHCNMEQVEWFMKHFKISWEITSENGLTYATRFENPLMSRVVFPQDKPEINNIPLKWLAKTHPKYVKAGVECIQDSLLNRCLSFVNFEMIKVIYETYNDYGGVDIPSWKKFPSKLFRGVYEMHNSLMNLKNIYIYGIKNGKITDIDIRIIRGLCITLDDFKNKEDNMNTIIRPPTHIIHYSSGYIISPYLFEDELKTKEQHKYIEPFKKYTRQYCELEKIKIIEYLKHIKTGKGSPIKKKLTWKLKQRC